MTSSLPRPHTDLHIEGSAYHSLMQFEAPQTKETLGPFVLENALSNVPIFGPDRDHFAAIVETTVEAHATEQELLVDEVASTVQLPESFAQASTLAEKLKSLRKYIWGITHPDLDEDEFDIARHLTMLARFEAGGSEDVATQSSRSLHEALIRSTMEPAGFPKPALVVLDHIMLIRAKENYLLDCHTNRNIVDDDPWLKSVWGWIEGTLNAVSLVETFQLTTILQLPKRLVKTAACELIH